MSISVEHSGGPSALTTEMDNLELGKDDLDVCLEELMNTDVKKQHKAFGKFRKLLSQKEPPFDEVVGHGFVPAFVNLMRRDGDAQTQLEAAWAITNICSGKEEHVKAVIDSGAAPVLVRLLSSQFEEISEQALWALGNIAGDSAYSREVLQKHNFLQSLLLTLRDRQLSLSHLRTAVWALSNMSRGGLSISNELVMSSIPILKSLLVSDDEDVLQDTCVACSYLSDGPADRLQMYVDNGLCKLIAPLLGHSNPAIVFQALRAIGNFVSKTNRQTQAVLNCGVLASITKILRKRPEHNVIREACWVTSNVTAGSPRQIQMVLDETIMPTLVNLLRFGPPDVRREAGWAVGNALAGGLRDQVCEIATQPCIRALCNLLSDPEAEIVGLALHGLQNALSVNDRGSRDGDGHNGFDNPDDYDDDDDEFWLYARWIERAGGLAKLARLTEHSSEMIAEKATCLLHLLVDVPPEGLLNLEDLLGEEDLHSEEEEESTSSDDGRDWKEVKEDEQCFQEDPSACYGAGNSGHIPITSIAAECERAGD